MRPVNLLDVSDLQVRKGRSAGGAKGQKSGKSFEAKLDRSHAILRQKGVAFVVKNHVATVRTRGRDGSVMLRATGRGFVDYSGWIKEKSGMVPVCFDAKVVTGKAQYSLEGLQPHQKATVIRQLTDMLEWYDSSDRLALSFLLFYCDEMETVWLAGPDAMRRLAAGLPVPIRKKLRDGTIEHDLPYARLSTMKEMAMGAPEIPWIAVALSL